MEAINPSVLVPPNLWTFTVLPLKAPGPEELFSWRTSVAAMLPEQVVRMSGFEFSDLQAFYEPLLPPDDPWHLRYLDVGNFLPARGHPFLLSLELASGTK